MLEKITSISVGPNKKEKRPKNINKDQHENFLVRQILLTIEKVRIEEEFPPE